MSEYAIISIACAVIVLIMLLFGICYALFMVCGILRDLFYLFGGVCDDDKL